MMDSPRSRRGASLTSPLRGSSSLVRGSPASRSAVGEAMPVAAASGGQSAAATAASKRLDMLLMQHELQRRRWLSSPALAATVVQLGLVVFLALARYRSVSAAGCLSLAKLTCPVLIHCHHSQPQWLQRFFFSFEAAPAIDSGVPRRCCV